jgi:hypothetical protein
MVKFNKALFWTDMEKNKICSNFNVAPPPPNNIFLKYVKWFW